MDEDTRPLPKVERLAPGNVAFQGYLQYFRLEPLDVAIASRVRYLTVWNIGRDIPVDPAHAVLVRAGLRRLTGVPYTASIAVIAKDTINTARVSHQ